MLAYNRTSHVSQSFDGVVLHDVMASMTSTPNIANKASRNILPHSRRKEKSSIAKLFYFSEATVHDIGDKTINKLSNYFFILK